MTQSGLDSRFYFQCLQKNMTSNWPQYHTVRKSEIMSKNSIFRKIQNSEFEFFELKSNDFWEGLPGYFLFSRQKSWFYVSTESTIIENDWI